MRSGARISRVHNSWRVRVPGLKPKFFADQHYGGTHEAFNAAAGWRDTHWDGKDRSRKLTRLEREVIRRSTEHYKIVAEKYQISPNYVHKIRRGRSRE